ncbi:MAG: DNA glycosylase AlkZ-like family protein [Burkholderiales bacterium]|jgi:uncharacterized protein YcaQ|nr:winged helix DNA-binding domain-containing protein [Betaproteobacteria bacterium]
MVASNRIVVDLDTIRRMAVSQSLFAPTTLARAITKLGFVQADPIRAPARAQDLTLRHRVKNYRAGDLEAKYAKLDVEEDFFINHGFVPRDIHHLMHPRVYLGGQAALVKKHSASVLAFVRDYGVVHPREVDAHFAHGSMTNAWGGTSSVTTQLLDGMHYRGMLRIVGRDKGIRLYGLPTVARPKRSAAEVDHAIDELLDVLLNKYAPIPANSISTLLGRLRWGVPQWQAKLPAAIKRAKERMAQTTIDGVTWYWPAEAKIGKAHHVLDDDVRLLAPFDPIVWDRRRFEMLWGWAYRFEAYTPVAKRKLGYYALPMLWRGNIIGWGNLSVKDDALVCEFGYVSGGAPKEREFRLALAVECENMQHFLRLSTNTLAACSVR